MPDSKSLNDDYFIKNAILCWLHHYPNHKWTAIYKELAERDSYVTQFQPVVETKSSSDDDSKPVSRKQSRGRSTPKSNPTES